MNFFGVVRELLLAKFTAGDIQQPNIDTAGNIGVTVAYSNAAGGLPVAAPFATDNSAVAPASVLPQVLAQNYLFNTANALWVRQPNNNFLAFADAVAPVATPPNFSMLYGFNGASADRITSGGNNADGIAVSTLGKLDARNYNHLYNGASFDRERGTTEHIVLASAIRSANNNSAAFTNYNNSNIIVFLDITAVTAAQTIQIIIEGKDPVSGNYVTITTGTATGAIGTTITQSTPGGFTASVTPRTWRVRVVHSAAGNFTYSVGASTT